MPNLRYILALYEVLFISYLSVFFFAPAYLKVGIEITLHMATVARWHHFRDANMPPVDRAHQVV
jgi:hypothetical protein